MRHFIRNLVVAILCLTLTVPAINAQNHTTGSRGNNRTHQTSPRPGNNGQHNNRPVNNRPNRPGNNNNRPNNNRPNNSRPDNNKPNRPVNNNNNRPNNNRPNNNRPNNSRPDNNRPNRPDNNRPNNNNRPTNNRPNNSRPNRPDNNRPNNRPNNNRPNNNRPGNNNWHFGNNDWHYGKPNPPRPHRPGVGHPRPPMMQPPMRPHRPRPSVWHRPVPPHSWRPRPHAPSIAAILGITFGTALNLSLDYLLNNGYSVDGYGNNTVYLRDINQFNYYWPDATLYYGNGGLARSEFLYSTTYPDMMRYNSLYNSFLGTYGSPVNYVNNGASLSATWFAPNRGYVTLQYTPQYSLGGQIRYFTTLTFGL